MDAIVPRFGKNLREKLGSLLGEKYDHTAGDGIGARVQFEAGSSDLFVVNVMDASCTSLLKFTDGNLAVPLEITTPTLSLKNLSGSDATQCYDTQWKAALGLSADTGDMIDEQFRLSGRYPGEPSFVFSLLHPNTPQTKKVAPTIICPHQASLLSPFQFQAIIGDPDPDEVHTLQVCVLVSFSSL